MLVGGYRMSLSFVGPNGSFETRWIVFALLRDNVQHHLEGGEPSGRFPAIHGITAALGGTASVDAVALRTEAELAHDALVERPADDVAISARTAAVAAMTWPPRATGTWLLEGAPIPTWSGPPPRTLGNLFGTLLDSILAITAGANAGDVVEIIDS
jgi:hypothetical protein